MQRLASTLMCFSMNVTNVERIAATFAVNPPKLYRRSMSKSALASMPNLAFSCNGNRTLKFPPMVRSWDHLTGTSGLLS
jgi:hypothetical protein